jgi:hypothetical protein
MDAIALGAAGGLPSPPPYSAISAGTLAGPASGISSISTISSVAPAISAAAAANT